MELKYTGSFVDLEGGATPVIVPDGIETKRGLLPPERYFAPVIVPDGIETVLKQAQLGHLVGPVIVSDGIEIPESRLALS